MNRKQIKKSKKWICLVLCGLALAGTALWKILPDCLDNLSSAAAYEDLRDRYTDAPGGTRRRAEGRLVADGCCRPVRCAEKGECRYCGMAEV